MSKVKPASWLAILLWAASWNVAPVAAQPQDADNETDAQPHSPATPDASSGAGDGEEGSEARRYFDEGRQAYDQGNFVQALRLFEKARELAGPRQRVFLDFNIAQTHDRLGNEEEALRRYEAYLREAPDGPRAGIAAGRVQVLRTRIAERREAEARREAELQRVRAEERERALRAAPARPGERSDGTSWVPWAVAGGAVLVAGAVAAAILLQPEPQPTAPDGPVRFSIEAIR